ncbi:MAG: DoxX family protein [Pseudomonadota bacterium]
MLDHINETNTAGNNFGKLVLRLTLGVLMLFHGYAKLSGDLVWLENMLAGYNLPPQLAYGVYVGEILAPIMIILGAFCRFGGLIIVVNMGFALFLAHQSELLLLNESGGYALEVQAFFLFTALAIVFLGSGRYAVRPD